MSQANVNKKLPNVVVIVDEKAEQNISQVSEKEETAVNASEEQSTEGEEIEVEGSESQDDDTIEEEYEEDFHGEGEDSIDSSESDEDEKFAKQSVYLKRKKLPKMKKDFFKDFLKIPNIDRISLDESMLSATYGDDIVADLDEEEEQSVEDTQLMEEQSSESAELSEYDFDFPSEEEEKAAVITQKISEENLFENLVKLIGEPTIIEEAFDLEELERLREEHIIYVDTQTFLKQLIGLVVETAEYIDPKVILRENLDKVKLCKELIQAFQENRIEKDINICANRKAIEYYRRLKNFRPITPEPCDRLEYEMRRFNEAIAILDNQLGTEVTMAKMIEQEIQKSVTESEHIDKVLKKTISDCSSLIKKTLSNRGTERFASFVEECLSKMASLRGEISKLRQVFIRVQHDKGNLLVKIDELNTIDKGIRLLDYENLLEEVNALKKKLEERDKSLDRKRIHFNLQVGTLAHIKEKETMVYHALTAQKVVLKDAFEIRNNMRARIHQMRIKRICMKRQINELSFECGLIGKPALCLDYDVTQERCNELKRIVKEKEAKISKIEQRIDICVSVNS